MYIVPPVIAPAKRLARKTQAAPTASMIQAPRRGALCHPLHQRIETGDAEAAWVANGPGLMACTRIPLGRMMPQFSMTSPLQSNG